MTRHSNDLFAFFLLLVNEVASNRRLETTRVLRVTTLTQKWRQRSNQFSGRGAFVDEIRACISCRGGIVGIYAEQDNVQVGIGPAKQTAGFRRGRTVETP